MARSLSGGSWRVSWISIWTEEKLKANIRAPRALNTPKSFRVGVGAWRPEKRARRQRSELISLAAAVVAAVAAASAANLDDPDDPDDDANVIADSATAEPA
jgi:hypothetical protein